MCPLDNSISNQNKTERLKQLILNFQKRGNSKMTSKISEESYHLIQFLFCNPSSYSYSITKTIKFVAETKIEPQLYVDYVSEVIRVYFSNRTSGQKRVRQYIDRLKATKKLNPYKTKKLTLRKEKTLYDLFRLVDHIYTTLNCSKDEAVSKVHAFSFSGKAHSTFRRLYFDVHRNSDI